MNLLNIFIETLNATIPVFAMVLLGVALKYLKWIDHSFINTASKLVFRGALPTLIFLSIIDADLTTALIPGLMIYFALATLIAFLISWAWAVKRIDRADRGVYVQGAFRGNGSILGLALAGTMYGDYGLSVGGILASVLIPLYNILAVIVLSSYQPGKRASWQSIVRNIITNPLIIAVVAALLFSSLGLQLPTWLHTSGRYFANVTMPLALICIGGTLSMTAIRESSSTALGASWIKIFWLPLLATAGAWLVGFRDAQLGLLFVYFSSPSAASSFVMAQAMGGNAKLAANIIAITTVGSSLTVTAGVFLLQLIGTT
ncbi:AEC family transporter [Phytohalomonas tamaricis]|uniref:AEC family transporter n=1 Tax=Phytohalomonas tamaricis TaxID=2081032 RepID=UPI000D0ADA64|nr:AEC family transporter [Phytohalomonas tamaricis]